MTPVYLPNGQTAYVWVKATCLHQTPGGRQSVTDRLDRGDRGRGGGEEDAIEVLKITMIINGRGGGGRRRDDSRDAPMHRARPY